MEIPIVTADIAKRCILFGACSVPKVGTLASKMSASELIWAERIFTPVELEGFGRPLWTLSGYGSGVGDGTNGIDGSGSGYGDGTGTQDGDGYGTGDGSGRTGDGYGTGDGSGRTGDGYGDGTGYGRTGSGFGFGYGLGSLLGSGYGVGAGSGTGYGDMANGIDGSGTGYGDWEYAGLGGYRDGSDIGKKLLSVHE